MTWESHEGNDAGDRQQPFIFGNGRKKIGRSSAQILMPLFLLMCCGCLNVERDPYPTDWLRPAPIDALKELEGRYVNHGEKTFSGHSDSSMGDLWYFLTRRITESCVGDTVRITLLSPGALLVELANAAGEVRQSARVNGADLKIVDDVIRMRPHSEAEAGSMATGVGTETCRLRRAEGGGLVGETDGIATGLLLYAIPIIGVGRDWIFWARVEGGEGHTSGQDEQ